MRDYWDVVGALWNVIDIYEGPGVFRQTYNSVPRESGLIFAAHHCQWEVCSGGFEQFFWNPTGVLAPEAVKGFREIGLLRAAVLVEGAIELLGPPYTRDRGKRKSRLSQLPQGAFDTVDETFFASIKLENGGFRAAANRYVEWKGQKRNAASGLDRHNQAELGQRISRSRRSAAMRCSRSVMTVCALRLLRRETLTETKKRDQPLQEGNPAHGLGGFEDYLGQFVLTIFRFVTVMSPVSCSSLPTPCLISSFMLWAVALLTTPVTLTSCPTCSLILTLSLLRSHLPPSFAINLYSLELSPFCRQPVIERLFA